MKTCPGCQTPTADDATTCVVCGTPLEGEAGSMPVGHDDQDAAMTPAIEDDTHRDTDHDTRPDEGVPVEAAAWPGEAAHDEAAHDEAADDEAPHDEHGTAGSLGPADGAIPPPPPLVRPDPGATTGRGPVALPSAASAGAPGAAGPGDGAVLVSESARNWALLAHVSGIVASSVVGMGFLGPLLVWVLKRDEDPFVAQNASEALNFQLSMFLYGILLVVASLPVITLIATIPLAIVGFMLWLILPIVAAVKASRAEAYSYPITIGFVRP